MSFTYSVAWRFLLALSLLFLDSPKTLVVLAVLVLLTTVRRVRWLGLALMAWWGMVFSQGLFYSVEPRLLLVDWGFLQLSYQGMLHGVVQGSRVVIMGLLGAKLVFGRRADALITDFRRLGLPESVVQSMSMVLGLFPVWLEEVRQIRQALAWRGLPWYRSLVPLQASLIRRSVRMAETLDSRQLSIEQAWSMPVWERRLLWGYSFLVVMLLAVKTVYWLYKYELWYRFEWWSFYAWAEQWL